MLKLEHMEVIIVSAIFLVIVMFTVSRNKHAGVSAKFFNFSFRKEPSLPLIHNTETATGSTFDGLRISSESGQQAFKNEAQNVSVKNMTVDKIEKPESEYNSKWKGGYVHFHQGAKVDWDNVDLEVSQLVNESSMTNINNLNIKPYKNNKK